MIRALVAGVLALVFASPAFPARHGSEPLPPFSAFVIAPADFAPGTKAIDTPIVLPGQQGFLRILGRTKLGGQPLTAVALAIVYRNADLASGDFGTMRTEVGLTEGREKFGEEWGAGLARGAATGPSKEPLTIKKTTVGHRKLLGRSAFRLPVTFKTSRGLLRMSLGVAQADRVVDIVALIPTEGHQLAAGDVNGIITATLRHLRTAFTVSNLALPTIRGAGQQGGTLTLDEGAWSGAPSAFAYAWSRCDATGNACTPIAGATTKSYALSAADSGATLRVAVTGSNSVSTGQATSPPTVAVL